MVKLSTGLINRWLGNKESLGDIFNFGCSKLNIYYSTSIPNSANDAVSGSLLITVTNASTVVKAKQKVRITPTVGTANAAVWNVVLNGTTVSFTDDGTPSATEICTGLYNAIRVACGTVAVTTPACTINNPDIYQKFTLTDNTGTLDIESATAGISFDLSVSVSGAGAGTGSMAAVTTVEDAYGLRFEAYSGITSGIMEKLSTQTWSGAATATGIAVYGRLVLDSDTGGLSTTEPRIQGQVAVSGGDFNISHIDITTGETITASSFSIEVPEYTSA